MNPETQRRDLLEADVLERNIDADIDISGVAGVATRNAWRSVDAKLAHGDVLVVAALDHIGRCSLDVMGKIYDLVNRGVRLCSVAVNGARFEAVPGERLLVTWSLFVVAEAREELLGMHSETNLSLPSPDLPNSVRALLQLCCDNDESEWSCNKCEATIMHGEGRFHGWPVEVREAILVKCAPSRAPYEGVPCLIWMGSLGAHGRPQMDKKRTEFATPYVYRVTYQLEYGQLDDGITIDHLCGNTRCIEPYHLRPLRVPENSAGGTARHRPRQRRQAPLVHFQPYDHIERTVCSQNSADVTSKPSEVTCGNCSPTSRQFQEARKQGLID